MSYYISKTIDGPFDAAVEKVKAELKKEGFGVLTEIDVRKTLKDKLGIDFRNYRILGACNPPSAYEALQAEDKIGLMLPCNLIVQDLEGGRVEAAAIDPVASMASVGNPALEPVGLEVRARLKRVVDAL